eukprot:1093141-Amphidinium_carterae.1
MLNALTFPRICQRQGKDIHFEQPQSHPDAKRRMLHVLYAMEAPCATIPFYDDEWSLQEAANLPIKLATLSTGIGTLGYWQDGGPSSSK